jgi:hypothetical protein
VHVLGKFNVDALRVCTYDDDPIWSSSLSLKDKKIQYTPITSECELKGKCKKHKKIFYVDPANVFSITNEYPGEAVTLPGMIAVQQSTAKFTGFLAEADGNNYIQSYKHLFESKIVEENPEAPKKGRGKRVRDPANATTEVQDGQPDKCFSRLSRSVLTRFEENDVVLVTHENWEGSFPGWVERTVPDPFYAHEEGLLYVVHVPFEFTDEKGIQQFEATTLLVSEKIASACLLKVTKSN